MFLVLIEYVDDGDCEWSVCAHGANGLRASFATREAADDYARAKARDSGSRYAVVQVTTVIECPANREMETPAV